MRRLIVLFMALAACGKEPPAPNPAERKLADLLARSVDLNVELAAIDLRMQTTHWFYTDEYEIAHATFSRYFHELLDVDADLPSVFEDKHENLLLKILRAHEPDLARKLEQGRFGEPQDYTWIFASCRRQNGCDWGIDRAPDVADRARACADFALQYERRGGADVARRHEIRREQKKTEPDAVALIKSVLGIDVAQVKSDADGKAFGEKLRGVLARHHPGKLADFDKILAAAQPPRDPPPPKIEATAGPTDSEINEKLEALRSPDAWTRVKAAEALGRSRIARAVEPLRAAAADPDPSVRRAAAVALARIGVADLDLFRAGDVETRGEILYALIDNVSKSASPVIEEGLNDPVVKSTAALLLSKLDPADARIPAIINDLLAAPDPDIYRSDILSSIALNSPAALAALVAATRDPREDVARIAVDALACHIRDSEDARAAARDAVKHASPRVRESAASALVALSKKGDDRVASLLAGLLKDPEAAVRLNAARLLSTTGAVSALPALVDALNDPNYQVVWAAGDAVADIDCNKGKAVDGLIKALDIPAARFTVLTALGRYGPRAKPALPAIEALVTSSTDDEITRSAVDALSAIGPVALPSLEKVARDPRAGLRRSAIFYLGLWGRSAKPALATLEAALKDDEVSVRIAAASALWRVDQNVKGLPALVDAAKTLKGFELDDVLDILRAFGPAAAPAATPLAEFARDTEDGAVAQRFAGLFASLGDAGVDALSRLLASKLPSTRRSAAYTLGDLGPAAAKAVPALEAVLNDSDDTVREAVADALKRIRP